MTLLYAALTDGTTTLVLTDGINFTLENDGWYPALALDSEQMTAVDAIKINILGAAYSGGPSDAGRVRVNQAKLLTMLRQIQRGQEGDGGIVTLVYTSPNSAPARRIACQVTRWDPTGMFPDLNNEENLTHSEINGVTLTLEHRVPWVWQSYLYENLLSGSLWATTPTPFSSTGTASWAATTGYYGGGGLIRLQHTSTGASSITTSDTISVTNGVPITITFTAGWLAGVTNIRSYLFSGGIVRSGLVDNSVSGSASLTGDGRRFTATLTPNFTGSPVIYWQITGVNGNITEISEVFVHATVAETWHLDTILEGQSTPTTAAHPINAAMAVPVSPALADTKLTVYGIPNGNTYPTALGEILHIIGTPASVVLNYPNGTAAAGMFTNPADAAAWSLGGTVLRFTPAVAYTYYPEPTAPITMLDAMPVGTSMFSLRQLQIVLVCRNNSATSTFTIYVEGYASQGNLIASRVVSIPPNGTDPVHILMPALFNGEGFYDYRLQMAGSVAGQTLDIDRVICAGINEETTIGLTYPNYGVNQTGDINYDPQTLSAPGPALFADVVTGAPVRLKSPSTALIRSRSASVRVIVDALSDGKWQIGGAAAATLTARLTRPPAFDAPL